MATVSPYNLDIHQHTGSFNQKIQIKDLDNSSVTAEKTQTISQRALSYVYQTLMAPVNLGVNFFKGAVIMTGVDGITSQGKTLTILHKALFNPDCIGNDFGIHKLSVNWHMAESIVFEIPIIEEVLFRGLLQDIVLKRGVKKAVELVSPKHAEFVDSQEYTAARILLTSAITSYFQLEFVQEKSVAKSFFKGIVFGILKEKYGLASAIGAHMLHAFTPMAPGLFSRCGSMRRRY